MYDSAMKTISEAVSRIAKAAELVERQAHMLDVEIFQKMLSLNPKVNDTARSSCQMLPVARNRRFFGRNQILTQIDNYLQPGNTSNGLRSLAIYGLGGVGKTRIALEYAYSKKDEVDNLLWVPAEDILALQQGFTTIAVDGLKLPNATRQSHEENMLLVVSWLQQTGKNLLKAS